jgi:hypothetical protein
VEGRGKGIRLQHLVPIPRGESVQAVASELLARLDRQASKRRAEDGKTVIERFDEERSLMLPLLSAGFDPSKVVLCEVSRSARIKVNGASYSVPMHWHSLQATVYVGAAAVRIICRGESVTYDRQGFGRKVVRYVHYLPELARKPQAVRQVAAEVLAELGEPYGALWRLLVDVHGPAEAARVFAKVLGAVVEHGRDRVAAAVASALASNRTDLLDLGRDVTAPSGRTVDVPASLAGYDVEKASATDYDALLYGAQP